MGDPLCASAIKAVQDAYSEGYAEGETAGLAQGRRFARDLVEAIEGACLNLDRVDDGLKTAQVGNDVFRRAVALMQATKLELTAAVSTVALNDFLAIDEGGSVSSTLIEGPEDEPAVAEIEP